MSGKQRVAVKKGVALVLGEEPPEEDNLGVIAAGDFIKAVKAADARAVYDAFEAMLQATKE